MIKINKHIRRHNRENGCTHFSIRHSRYFLENCLHFSDLWPADFRQLMQSFFSCSKSTSTTEQNRYTFHIVSLRPSCTNMFHKHLNIHSVEDRFKAINSTRSHRCIWSKGNIPFSGGTGLAPLFPPNAPPIHIKQQQR